MRLPQRGTLPFSQKVRELFPEIKIISNNIGEWNAYECLQEQDYSGSNKGVITGNKNDKRQCSRTYESLEPCHDSGNLERYDNKGGNQISQLYSNPFKILPCDSR